MGSEQPDSQRSVADGIVPISRRNVLLASGGVALLPGLEAGGRTDDPIPDRSPSDLDLEAYLENPAMVAENQTEPHVPTIPYPSVEAALGGDQRCASPTERRDRSPFVRSLEGEWDFVWSLTPDGAPNDFDAVDDWDRIDVPSVWQTEGYGHAMYRNVPVPMTPYEPPEVPDTINPVGTYRRTVTVPGNWTKDRRTFLRFEGIKSAAFVWVNGRYVGYDQAR